MDVVSDFSLSGTGAFFSPSYSFFPSPPKMSPLGANFIPPGLLATIFPTLSNIVWAARLSVAGFGRGVRTALGSGLNSIAGGSVRRRTGVSARPPVMPRLLQVGALLLAIIQLCSIGPDDVAVGAERHPALSWNGHIAPVYPPPPGSNDSTPVSKDTGRQNSSRPRCARRWCARGNWRARSPCEPGRAGLRKHSRCPIGICHRPKPARKNRRFTQQTTRASSTAQF